MADKGLVKTSGAYLFAKICSILVKGTTMTILGVDAEEEFSGDEG